MADELTAEEIAAIKAFDGRRVKKIKEGVSAEGDLVWKTYEHGGQLVEKVNRDKYRASMNRLFKGRRKPAGRGKRTKVRDRALDRIVSEMIALGKGHAEIMSDFPPAHQPAVARSIRKLTHGNARVEPFD